MIDLNKIEATAKSATPGPWVQTNGVLRGADGSDVTAAGYGLGHGAASPIQGWGAPCKRKQNADFLHATDPATVLEMVGMIRERDDVLRLALEALEHVKPMVDAYWGGASHDEAIAAIKGILK